MAIQLNVQRVFCPPLSLKPLTFFFRANRAVSLLSINLIKWVAAFAVRLSGVECRNGIGILKAVLSSREQLQVLDVNAPRLSANVIHDKPLSNISVGQKPSNPVGAAIHSAKEEGSIPVLVNLTLPHVAVASLFPLRIKSFFVGHVSPLKARVGAWHAWGNS